MSQPQSQPQSQDQSKPMGFLLRLRQQFFPGMGMQAMKQEVGKLSDKDKADLHEWLNKEGMPTAPPTTAVATETEKA